jgi:hypothetical protein
MLPNLVPNTKRSQLSRARRTSLALASLRCHRLNGKEGHRLRPRAVGVQGPETPKRVRRNPLYPWWPPFGSSSPETRRRPGRHATSAPWPIAPNRPGHVARKGWPSPVGLGRGLSRAHSLRAS